MTTRAATFTTFASLALCCTTLAALAQSRRDEPAPSRRCVGISTAILRSENPVITRVYRAYDDGTVESYDDGAPDAKWTRMK